MRRPAARSLPAAALALLAAIPAAGAPPLTDRNAWQVQLDSGITRIAFTLGALWHTVHGRAGPASAELRYDPGSGRLEGWVRVPAASLETGNGRRDETMLQEVLAAGTWPDIVLWPRQAAGDLDPATGGALQVEAELELRGERHPLSFPVEVLVTDPATGSFTADLAFSVPYVAWGLPDPSGLILRVDKEVRVTVRAAGRLRPPEDGD